MGEHVCGLGHKEAQGSKVRVSKAAAQELVHENHQVKAMTFNKKQYVLLGNYLKINYSLFSLRRRLNACSLSFVAGWMDR